MSRSDDIAFLEGRIGEIAAEQKVIADRFNATVQHTTEQIEKVLRDAGVLDVVRTIEAARDRRRGEAQASIQALATQAKELSSVREWLERRRDDIEGAGGGGADPQG
mgnify:CR=1 FL=1